MSNGEFRMRRHVVGSIFTVAVGWAPMVCAQDDPPRADAEPIRLQSRDDVYVNDSFEVDDSLVRLAAHQRRGQWLEASRLAESLFESYADRLVRVENGTYWSVVRRLNHIVSRWPAEGLSAYRDLYDRAAGARYERAAAARDLPVLLELWDRYFCTSVAVRIAETAVELAIESGDFATARQICVRMLAEHPDAESLADTLSTRLVLIAALEARRVSRHADASDEATIRWSGETTALAPLVDSVIQEVGELDRTDPPGDWPVFGGGPSRNLAGSHPLDRLDILWRFDDFPLGFLPPRMGRSESDALSGDDDGKMLMFHPVAGGGLIFFQGPHDVWALHRRSGRAAWHFSGTDSTTSPYEISDSSVPPWFCPTLDGDRLYASLRSGPTPYYSDESTPPAALVCLDAGTGRVIWRSDEERFGPSFSKVRFGTSPLVSGGCVYVLARKRRTSGFEDCYLLCLRASDGDLIYQTHLGSASTGGFAHRRPTLAIPALDDGILYIATNLGTVAAVTARTGRVRWLRTYERQPEVGWRTSVRSAGYLMRPWQYNPVLCTEKRVICRPNDAPIVLVLGRDEGTAEHVIDADRLAGADMLLGVHDGKLYGVGKSAFAFDLERGATVWTTPLPPDAKLFGRGTVSAGRMLVPTTQSLCSYDLTDGSRSVHAWPTKDSPGNLLAISDELVVAGYAHVTALGHRVRFNDALRKKAATHSEDPSPALDLAEIAFVAGNAQAAKAALEDAFERLERAGERIDQPTRTRMFRDCLWFAEDWPVMGNNGRRSVDALYAGAGRCAPDTAAHADVRLRYARHLIGRGDPKRAVDLYQQLLSDRSLREALIGSDGSEVTFGAIAAQQIEELIHRHGRGVYRRYDAESANWLGAARESGDIGLLDRIESTRPAAEVLPQAMMLKAELLRKAGEPLAAARTLRSIYRSHLEQLDVPDVLWKITECYAAAGAPEFAWAWANKAAREYPSARVDFEGRKRSFGEIRERFEAARAKTEPRRPQLDSPLTKRYERRFDQSIVVLESVLDAAPDTVWQMIFLFSGGRVRALDARTGDPLWDHEPEFGLQPDLLIATKNRVVLSTPYRIVGLEATTGRMVWTVGQTPGELADPGADPEHIPKFHSHAYHEGRLFSVWDDGSSSCVRVDDDRVVWRRDEGPRPMSSPVLDDKWVVYRGKGVSGTAAYCALDAASGRLLRAVDPGSSARVLAMHLTQDEKLIVVQTQSVAAYDLPSGRLDWRVPQDQTIVSSTVRFDGEGVFFSADAAHVVKISQRDGSTMWESDPVAVSGLHRARSELDGGLYLILTDRKITTIDTMDGRIVHQWSPSSETEFRGHFVGRPNVVSLASKATESGRLYLASLFGHRETPVSAASDTQPELVTLGKFDNALKMTVRDSALILYSDRTLIGWTGGGE